MNTAGPPQGAIAPLGGDVEARVPRGAAIRKAVERGGTSFAAGPPQGETRPPRGAAIRKAVERGGKVPRRPLHGVLLLDKPLGWSSNDALQKA